MILSVAILGQSNESGQGQTVGFNAGLGAPVMDPTKPRGQAGLRSWFPSMARELGKNGHWLAVYNHAIGASSFSQHHCGMLVNWTSGMLPGNSLFVMSNGGIWKSDFPMFTTIPESYAPPTGTASYTSTEGIPWVYIRAQTPQDIHHVFMPDEHLFDPRGYVAAFGNSIPLMQGKKILTLSIGQSDSNLLGRGTSKIGDFRDAYISLTKYALDKGIDEVYMGFTSYAPPPVFSSRYPDLVSDIGQAFQYFSGDQRVKMGVNLWQALGNLPTNADPRVVGLYDGLHMSDAAYERAGQLWAECILN